MTLIAMGFEQGFRTGKAGLKLRDPKQEIPFMAYGYAAALIKERPWEQLDDDDDQAEPAAANDGPKLIVP